MKFFFQYVAPILAILWLAQVHPLGAVVAVLLCLIRCSFRSRLLGRLWAHFLYDVLKGGAVAIIRFIFSRRRL